jgi:hypothetical protein
MNVKTPFPAGVMAAGRMRTACGVVGSDLGWSESQKPGTDKMAIAHIQELGYRDGVQKLPRIAVAAVRR